MVLDVHTKALVPVGMASVTTPGWGIIGQRRSLTQYTDTATGQRAEGEPAQRSVKSPALACERPPRGLLAAMHPTAYLGALPIFSTAAAGRKRGPSAGLQVDPGASGVRRALDDGRCWALHC